jgi:hypothetical protein
MPFRASIGNTNVGIYNPLSLVIGAHPAGYYSMGWIRDLTYPTQPFPNSANIGDYAQAAGQWLFQIQIRSNNGSLGSVSITYPWSETSSGTSFIGGSRQAYSYTYPYITISATRVYPYTFQYWQVDGGGVYSYSNPLNVYPTDNAIANNWPLVAVFA